MSAGASRWQRGRKLTPEHRANIAAAQRGRKLSPERVAVFVTAGAAASAERRRGRPAPNRGDHYEWFMVLDGDPECVYCGAPATDRDHVIPRGRPGWDDPGNLVPACASCNRSKKHRTPEEWFAQDAP